ncbi:hypothetical protein FEM03_14150 [Phragmitibacter flavus]|uniref:Uncharacterized protein n=1 Tax=Phragmitibacter flavus TaxID=2576071 RepID=A0A5R8KDE4_9BACT|nr:hypothetical protein [Phragmitibacter flavus]TLD70321.1 hypothetical protein FEM03_14150 [Phragmitibacter flavus]
MKPTWPISYDPPNLFAHNFCNSGEVKAELLIDLENELMQFFNSSLQLGGWNLPEQEMRYIIHKIVDGFYDTALKFPIFGLANDPPKFVRCSYRSTWRQLCGMTNARALESLMS